MYKSFLLQGGASVLLILLDRDINNKFHSPILAYFSIFHCTSVTLYSLYAYNLLHRLAGDLVSHR